MWCTTPIMVRTACPPSTILGTTATTPGTTLSMLPLGQALPGHRAENPPSKPWGRGSGPKWDMYTGGWEAVCQTGVQVKTSQGQKGKVQVRRPWGQKGQKQPRGNTAQGAKKPWQTPRHAQGQKGPQWPRGETQCMRDSTASKKEDQHANNHHHQNKI